MDTIKSKKAQISIQFAWIFILVAGAIILIFFLTIVFKQKEISETKLSATVLSQLDTIFTGAGLSSGTVNIITTPDTELNFICDKEGFSEYSIKNTPLTKETLSQVIFAPDLTKGKTIITWALAFNAPFKVMNFLYVSSPDIRYIFVYENNNGFAKEIYDEFPVELLKEHTTQSQLSSIKDLNNYKAKFIFFEQGVFNLPDFFEDVDVSVIRVNQGSVDFYEKRGKSFSLKGSFPYIDNPSLYGAIFSEDAVFYECNMQKALKKLKTVSEIYSYREDKLKEYFVDNPSFQDCSLYYYNSIEDLSKNAEQCPDIKSCLNIISNDINEIKNNQDVLIRKSCPLIY